MNNWGGIADEFWQSIPEHFPSVELGVHIVMPNHVHGIIAIGRGVVPTPDEIGTNKIRGGINPAPTKTDIGANCRIFQIPIHKRDQMQLTIPCNHQNLATELLRTHHPRQRRHGTHLGIHRIQSHHVDELTTRTPYIFNGIIPSPYSHSRLVTDSHDRKTHLPIHHPQTAGTSGLNVAASSGSPITPRSAPAR